MKTNSLPSWLGYLVILNFHMRYEIESNQFCSVVYLWVPLVLKLMLSTPIGDVKTLIYELSYMYTVIEDHCMWSFILFIFALSYKLSTDVSSL